MAPHICEELWTFMGHATQLANRPWPAYAESALTRDEVTLVVQVNCKVRGKVTLPADASEDEARSQALAVDNVARHVEGKTVMKVVVIPGKLVSIVVA